MSSSNYFIDLERELERLRAAGLFDVAERIRMVADAGLATERARCVLIVDVMRGVVNNTPGAFTPGRAVAREMLEAIREAILDPEAYKRHSRKWGTS